MNNYYINTIKISGVNIGILEGLISEDNELDYLSIITKTKMCFGAIENSSRGLRIYIKESGIELQFISVGNIPLEIVKSFSAILYKKGVEQITYSYHTPDIILGIYTISNGKTLKESIYKDNVYIQYQIKMKNINYKGIFKNREGQLDFIL